MSSSERFDIALLDESAFSARQRRALARLAVGNAPDARWLNCPGGCGARALEVPDDDGRPLPICVDGNCSAATIQLSIDESDGDYDNLWSGDGDDVELFE